jgi:hypothetical protein cdifQCD-2_16846
MRNITEITKRDIFDILTNGIEYVDAFCETITEFYPYYGRLEEIEFLNRLYKLKRIKSYDSRFINAEEDIWQHTVNNQDYPYNWIFTDDRFELLNGTDEIFLAFICEIFNPEVRNEKRNWRIFFDEINKLIKEDGYELHVYKKISGRDVYCWKKYEKEGELFIPFSQRNIEAIKNKEIKVVFSKKIRHQIYQLLEFYNEYQYVMDETDFQSRIKISSQFWEDIKLFYIPGNYENGKWINSKNFEKFIKNTSPYFILDTIEIFLRHIEENKVEEFKLRVMSIFELNKIMIKFNNKKLNLILNTHLEIDSNIPIKEIGIEELLMSASKYYEKKEFSIAVEKIWDAFERIKSYYYPTKDKKDSANQIIKQISCGNSKIEIMFNEEFKTLTKIGNEYRIRHHEKNKINISDDRHYEYFYKRCLSLILTILKYL